MPLVGLDLALADISPNWTTVILIAMFVLGLVLVVSVPIIIDVRNAHRSWRDIVEKHPGMLGKLPGPVGVDGLARATMALGLLVAIGFGLSYVLVEHPFTNNETIITAILSALTTAFASVTAFYFGTRAVQAGQTGQSSDAQGGVLTVTITSPQDGAVFTVDDAVNAAYSAVPSPGAAITVLTGTVDNGAALDTSAAGTQTFTVNAEDSAGQKATTTHTYTVNAAK